MIRFLLETATTMLNPNKLSEDPGIHVTNDMIDTSKRHRGRYSQLVVSGRRSIEFHQERERSLSTTSTKSKSIVAKPPSRYRSPCPLLWRTIVLYAVAWQEALW
jgi:hypothetical protein